MRRHAGSGSLPASVQLPRPLRLVGACPARAAQPVFDQGDVRTELADVAGLEPADLELDDVAQLLDVEQQQVQHELVAVDVEPDVAAPTNAMPCPKASRVPWSRSISACSSSRS